LREWLKSSIQQFGGEDPVIIRPSPETRHERIIGRAQRRRRVRGEKI